MWTVPLAVYSTFPYVHCATSMDASFFFLKIDSETVSLILGS